MRQIIILFISLTVIYFGVTQKGVLLDILETGSFYAIPVSALFVGILVFFPVIPYPVLAGLIGSIFGVWVGLGISLVGIALGTIVMFVMARYGFQNWTQQTLEKYPKIKEYEGIFNKNAFLGIVAVRLIPVVPSPVVNILCGVSTVTWIKFLCASLIGKLPAVFIFTFAGSMFEENKLLSFLIYGIYFLILSVLLGIKLKRTQGVNV